MNNPFTSSLFVKMWLEHFNEKASVIKYDSIENVSFYKHKYLPFYINIGKNLTKGISYSLNYEASDFKGKTCLIYDVPDYFNVEELDATKSRLRCKKVFQYKGFALDFNSFQSSEDYIASRISSKNRRGYRSRLKRLEDCFDIKYSFLYGGVERAEYDILFQQFHDLLSKRFSEKEVNYHHLQAEKWHFYTELVYEMIKEKKASLFTIYNGYQPIGITLNFHSEDISFVTITVFDPDYYKFNVGKASIVKLLEWCYEQNIKIMDLSKGEFDFKYEWCNLVYDFNYHILYDSSSLKSITTANLMSVFFKMKSFLRKKKVNYWYRKLLFKIGNNDLQHEHDIIPLNIEYIEKFELSNDLKEIDMMDEAQEHFKKFVYSFLFLNPEPVNEVKVYQSQKDKSYFIKGKTKTQKITISS